MSAADKKTLDTASRRVPSIAPPNQAWPRAELEEMVERWLVANVEAERAGDWATHLGPMYTEDALYTWNIGPNEEFAARGRQEICDVALGYQMKGFEDWQYPYHDIIIDERRGTVIGFWKQRAPVSGPDGQPIEIAGIGGSWFEYAGDFQWKWQRDFFDFGNAKATFFQLAGMGALSPVVKEKIHRQARGERLPGHEPIGTPPSTAAKLRNGLAMAKIALLGK